MKPHDVSDGRLQVVHQEREEVPDRHLEEHERRKRRGDTRREQLTRHARAVAERTPGDGRDRDPRRVTRYSEERDRRDPRNEPAHAAVEREDRRRERRDLERQPPAVRERIGRMRLEWRQDDRRDRDRCRGRDAEPEQQEPEQRNDRRDVPGERDVEERAVARVRVQHGAGQPARRAGARRTARCTQPTRRSRCDADPARGARPTAGPRTSARAPRRSRRREARAGAPGSRARPASRPPDRGTRAGLRGTRERPAGRR